MLKNSERISRLTDEMTATTIEKVIKERSCAKKENSQGRIQEIGLELKHLSPKAESKHLFSCECVNLLVRYTATRVLVRTPARSVAWRAILVARYKQFIC